MKLFLLLAATMVFGASCGSSTDAALSQIDHLEIQLRPTRPFYPVNDTVRIAVIAVSREGTWLPLEPTVWRLLTPSIASLSPDTTMLHATALVEMQGRGDAMIEAEMAGVTVRVTVPIRGLLHTGHLLDHSETWLLADTPHIVEQELLVDDVFNGSAQDTVVLTIEPGVTVRFRPGAGLGFGDIHPGALLLSPGAPVTMEADLQSPPGPSWLGLAFKRSRSQLRNLTLRHCGQDYRYDHPAACITSAGAELLIDSVTISNGRNGVVLAGPLTPGSRKLSVMNTTGAVAVVAPDYVGTFPRGGQFSGNDDAEIRVLQGRITASVNWGGLPLAVRLTEVVSVDDPSNPVLTLPAGFHLRADRRGALTFPTGSLIAGDVAGAPVVLESAGDGWQGIAIEHGAGSALRNVVLQDCGVSFTLPAPPIPGTACLTFGPQGGLDAGLLVQDVVIRRSRGVGVSIETAGRFHPDSRNLTVTASAGYPLRVPGYAIASIPSGDFRGNGIDAIRAGLGFPDSTVLRPHGIPYRFADGLSVDSTLIVAPGVTIEVGLGTLVGPGLGNLIAVGTATDPIVFRSETPGVPGSWIGIEIGTGAGPATRFEHVVIADAGAGPGGFAGAIRLWSDPGGLLRNSTIIRSASCGIVLFNGAAWTDDYTDPAFGNTFTALAGPPRCQAPS